MTEVVIPLTIRDLTPEDLPSCAWSGSAAHLASVARALDRARRGEVDYLAVCPPTGLPVALGGIDDAKTPGAGPLGQLAARGALQSCGISRILIQAAEQRIRARGIQRAELGVEECNPRARALYERLGYLAYGREPGAWDKEAPDGSLTRYETPSATPGRSPADKQPGPAGQVAAVFPAAPGCGLLPGSALAGYRWAGPPGEGKRLLEPSRAG